jgi:L-alanine-DL-glutamate epimerase-like enolase superfamily enzyme
VKIAGIEVIQLVRPLDRELRNSKQVPRRRTATLVRLTTDKGIDGLGEAWCEPTMATAALLGKLRSSLIGEDPSPFPFPFTLRQPWR